MIQADRLLADLVELRRFGATGNGVIRPSFSDIDMQSRRWLVDRMHDAGLDASIDGIGNVHGCSRNSGPALLMGSHSDTQPTGGWLDGAMGVIYAIETARAFAEHDALAHLPVDAIAWVDEESTYASCLGSRAFCGLVTDDEIESAHNDAGESLREALNRCGLDGEYRTFQDRQYRGYLEPHIEQGPYLEETGRHIGVVTGIVGTHNLTVRFVGRQNHAGTTPMKRRSDAARALMDFGHQLNVQFSDMAGENTVWTIGRIRISPGAAAIVPGEADLHLQYRDQDADLLERLRHSVDLLADTMSQNGSVQVSVHDYADPIAPVDMNLEFQQCFAQAAEQVSPGNWMSMPSAAGHDAMFLAHEMPAGMMFVPSIDGISHDFSEDTALEDIVRGCEVFARTAAQIMGVPPDVIASTAG